MWHQAILQRWTFSPRGMQLLAIPCGVWHRLHLHEMILWYEPWAICIIILLSEKDNATWCKLQHCLQMTLTFRQSTQRATSLTDSQHTALRKACWSVSWGSVHVADSKRVCSAGRRADFPIVLTNNDKQTCPFYSLSVSCWFLFSIPFLFFVASTFTVTTLSWHASRFSPLCLSSLPVSVL